MKMSSSSTGRGLKKGAWTAEEDMLLKKCIEKHGEGKWHQVPLKAGLNRCRKSCRLRWLNYLRPNIKRGDFGEDEVDLIIRLHKLLGNRWSLIAGRIPGRTANDVKNYWNTHLHKKSSSSPLQKNKPEEFTREKTTTTTNTTIIKPRARTFSKSLNRFSGINNHVGNDTRAREDGIVNDKQSPATISDWINKCWADLLDENLLEEKEAESDGQVGWSRGGDTAGEREEEETNHQDGWCDFSIDWDLLDGLNIDQPFV